MGDFVVQQQMELRTHENSKEVPQPMLFGELEGPDESRRSSRDHSPILDFVLFGEDHVANLIAEAVDAWRQQWTPELTSVSNEVLE
jgi:hypothetical protein